MGGNNDSNRNENDDTGMIATPKLVDSGSKSPTEIPINQNNPQESIGPLVDPNGNKGE